MHAARAEKPRPYNLSEPRDLNGNQDRMFRDVSFT